MSSTLADLARLKEQKTAQPVSQPVATWPKQTLFELGQQHGLTQALFRRLRSGGLLHQKPRDWNERSLLALAACSGGDLRTADELLAGTGSFRNLDEQRLWLAATFFCASQRTPLVPEELARLTQTLGKLLQEDDGVRSDWTEVASACATLAFADGLLRQSDVGAARNQLEVALERTLPWGLGATARLMLAAIELGVGRADLALGHVARAQHDCPADSPEHTRLRLLDIGLRLLADGPGPLGSPTRAQGVQTPSPFLDPETDLGLTETPVVSARPNPQPDSLPDALPDSLILYERCRVAEQVLGELDQRSSPHGLRNGPGTLAHLHDLLLLLSQEPNKPLQTKAALALRAHLTWLVRRHGASAFCLLVVSLVGAALLFRDETCEGYDLLLQQGAELRHRYMDGVADLVERQIVTLRGQLNPDDFEALIHEARRRRLARAQAAMHRTETPPR